MVKVISEEKAAELKVFYEEKHPGTICVANYKGGVGKTTLVCLLGYYLAERTKKRVLLFDIDPQCSLSLAVGFDPEAVSKTELTIYNLVKPSKWTKVRKTKFENYVFPVPDTLSPEGLYIIRGSFDVDELDMEIAKSFVGEGKRRIDELFLYCKQMLNGFDKYDYVLVDCPPNKMFLTQAMLRACSFYLPVTIPDAIEARLGRSILGDLEPIEKDVLGSDALVGVIPRLDAIARFLGEKTKFSRYEFSRKTSGQPTIEECLVSITDTVVKRMEGYRAKA